MEEQDPKRAPRPFESLESLGVAVTAEQEPNYAPAVDILVSLFRETKTEEELSIFRRRVTSVAESQESARAQRFLPQHKDRERFHSSIKAAATLLDLAAKSTLSQEKRFYLVQGRRILEDLGQRLSPMRREASADGEQGLEDQMEEHLTFSTICSTNDEEDLPPTPEDGKKDRGEVKLDPDPELQTLSQEALRVCKGPAPSNAILYRRPRSRQTRIVHFEQSLESKIQQADLACWADDDETQDQDKSDEEKKKEEELEGVTNVGSEERMVVSKEALREMKAERRRLRRLKAKDKKSLRASTSGSLSSLPPITESVDVEEKETTVELKMIRPSRMVKQSAATELKAQGTHKEDYINVSSLSSEAMTTDLESGYRSKVVLCPILDAKKVMRFVQRAVAHPSPVVEGLEEEKYRPLTELRRQFWVEVATEGVVVEGGEGSLGYASFRGNEKGCSFQEGGLSGVSEEAVECVVAVSGDCVSQGVVLSRRHPDDPCFDRPSYSPRPVHKKLISGPHSVTAFLAAEVNRVKAFPLPVVSKVHLVRVADVTDAQLGPVDDPPSDRPDYF